MLLSDGVVSRYLRENFVLVWNSVRPVPKVTIDFGNGKVLERTLKGNTAFYVCRSDGTVVDSLPGVYLPDDFLKELKSSQNLLKLSNSEVLEFHRRRGAQVAQLDLPEVALGKGRIESPVLKLLTPNKISASKAAVQSPLLAKLNLEDSRITQNVPKTSASTQWNDSIEDVSAKPMTSEDYEKQHLPGNGPAGQRAMRADSQSSLRVLRPAIHKLFGEYARLPRPEECRAAIYKDILKVDIDDPYLGLKIEDIPGT